MEKPKISNLEHAPIEIQKFGTFDRSYFQELEGENGWIALGQENCMNQRYFTVYGNNNEKLGIVGVFDTNEEKNLTHTVVDPKYRSRGLNAKIQQYIVNELDLPFITMTIDLDNTASIKSVEKVQGIKKVSDAEYERSFHKVKYVLEFPEKPTTK